MLLVLYYLRNPYVAAQLGSRSLKINRSFKFGASDIGFGLLLTSLTTRVRVRRRCGSRPKLLRNSLLDPVHRLSNFRFLTSLLQHVPIPTRNCLHYGQPCRDRRPETSVLASSVQPQRRLLKMALARPLLVLRRLRPWRRDRCSGTSRIRISCSTNSTVS